MERGNIGLRIGELRRRTKLRQEDLAELLGIGRSAVAQWEAGYADPRARDLPALAKILKCKLKKLFEG